jgi:hypothetical protein
LCYANPKVNAIVTLVADGAMADAARADETLAHGRHDYFVLPVTQVAPFDHH